MSSVVNFTVAQYTHAGLRREDNQDDMAWFSLPAMELFIVVDGMGGAAGGKTAASMAVAAINQAFSGMDGTIPERLSYALNEANRQVHAKSRSDDERYRGMGTTAVVMAVGLDGLAHVAHVGDSRLYLCRNGGLQQITKDHTVVQRRIDSGLLPDEAGSAMDGHILTQALGPKEQTRPEVTHRPIDLLPGDLVLMCTDGLSDVVPNHQIRAVLDRIQSIEQAGGALIDAALQAGGPDNITAQLISIAGAESNVQSSARSQAADQPVIRHSIDDNSGARKWRPDGYLIILGAVLSILAIFFWAADGRFKTAVHGIQAKVAQTVDGVIKSSTRVTQSDEIAGQAESAEEATRAEVRPSGDSGKALRFHHVAPGDTLEAIARKYDMPLKRLLEINGLAADSPIYPGQTLVVHIQ